MALPQNIVEARTRLANKRIKLRGLLNFKSFDIQSLINSVPKNLTAQGQAALASLILTQGEKILKNVFPGLNSLLTKFGIDDIQSISLEDIESLKQEFCPTTKELDSIIEQRNNIINYLNNIGTQLDALSVTVNFGATFGELLQGIINTLKRAETIGNFAIKFVPFAPGLATSVLNDLGILANNLTFRPDGTPIIPPITITASQVSPSVSAVQNVILKTVTEAEKLDLLISLCNPNASLDPISNSILQSAESELLALESENQSTYKGFILEIETRPFSDTVDQNRAVGKNNDGIILISTNYSFASDPNVLIEELKFIIDRDDLKAY